MSGIFSNAYNFCEYISSGVDPRTGSYSLQINLGNFISMGGSGLTLPLIIGYDPSNPIDSGFGRGWTLPLSLFDERNNSLKLSTGQSFQIAWNDEKQEYDIPYRKLKDIRVFYIDKTNEIKIVFKNGREEYLSYEEGITKRVVSPQGITIHFEFSNHQGRKRLWKIYDIRREVEIDWWSNEFETVIKQTQSNEVFLTSRIKMKGSDRVLRYFSIDGFPEYLDIKYQYFSDTGYVGISEVIHPSGLKENIYYSYRHRLPNGAPIKYMICVQKYIRDFGEAQTIQQIDYQFSDANYLGFGSDKKWNNKKDNLFYTVMNYQYWSKEIINGNKTVMRKYNKYHLMILEESYDASVLFKKVTNKYYAITSLGIEQQPAQYSMLKSQATKHYFSRRERTITISYEYDEYANLTKEIKADGSFIKRDYYPATGEGASCPSEPNGMVSLIKSETFTPARNYTDPARVITYKYEKINRMDDFEKYFVVLKEEAHDSLKSRNEYYDEVHSVIKHGRIKVTTSYINEIEQSKTTFSYNDYFTYLEKVQEITVADGGGDHIIKTSNNVDYKYNNETRIENQEGLVSTIKYDGLCRVIEIINNPITEYESIKKVRYHVEPNNNYMIKTDPQGNETQTLFNNAGKATSYFIKLSGTTVFKLIKQMTYYSLGTLRDETNVDWFGSNRITTIKTSFRYDSYGEVREIKHQDGRIESIVNDRVSLSVMYTLPGLSITMTYYNLSGQEIKKGTYDADRHPLAITTFKYDGYGNVLKVTDTGGHEIDTTYDDFDRVKSVTRNIDSVSIVESYNYPSFTEKELPSEVKVNDKIIGFRIYDKLLRIKTEETAGVETSYTYDGISSRPQTITSPRSQTEKNIISFTYEPFLKLPLSRKTAPQEKIDASFEYNKKTGLLLETLNPHSKNSYKYDSFNRMVKETVILDNEKDKVATFAYSLLGKPMLQTDIDGGTRSVRYDRFARPDLITEIISGKTFSTEISYDDFSRANRYKIIEDVRSAEILLTFNAIGAETKRVVSFNSDEIYSIRQKYNLTLLLGERVFTENEQITKEEFKYDSLHRLIAFRCEGPNCPLDNEGNAIKSQTFTHDEYGNVTQAISIFVSGESNIRTFTYSLNNPTLLGRVQNTHKEYISVMECQYDGQGNLVNDEKGREYAYNVLGQVDTVYSDSSGKQFLTAYEYDATGQMVAQKDTNKELTFFYYLQGKLAHEMADGAISTYLSNAPGLGVRHLKSETKSNVQFLLGNAQESILQTYSIDEKGAQSVEKTTYSPYGESAESKK